MTCAPVRRQSSILYALGTTVFLLLSAACSDAGTSGEPEPSPSEPESAPDGGSAPPDGGSRDAGAFPDVDAGPANGICSFNRDCRSEQRCECDEVNGCSCADGERGTGVVGTDSCVDGNDCASSLCLEGPDDALVCSGPCETDADCGGAVPLCADIAFVGRICIRNGE